MSVERNSIKIGGPAHGIVTRMVYKTSSAGGEDDGVWGVGGYGVRGKGDLGCGRNSKGEILESGSSVVGRV